MSNWWDRPSQGQEAQTQTAPPQTQPQADPREEIKKVAREA